VPGRQENLPKAENKYSAFCDLSGGRSDASALAIGHRNDKKKIIIDALDWHPAPHDPHAVIAAMSHRLNEWGIKRVTGDAYAADFAARAFQDRGIMYTKCELTKSGLYAELLPILCAKEIELLDQPGNRMVKQLASLERRTRSGGKDQIDHPTGAKSHDDLSNAVAGLAYLLNKKLLYFGAVLN
jgi:hypothetical protein